MHGTNTLDLAHAVGGPDLDYVHAGFARDAKIASARIKPVC